MIFVIKNLKQILKEQEGSAKCLSNNKFLRCPKWCHCKTSDVAIFHITVKILKFLLNCNKTSMLKILKINSKHTDARVINHEQLSFPPSLVSPSTKASLSCGPCKHPCKEENSDYFMEMWKNQTVKVQGPRKSYVVFHLSCQEDFISHLSLAIILVVFLIKQPSSDRFPQTELCLLLYMVFSVSTASRWLESCSSY